MQKPVFCDDVEAFLKMKKPSTQHAYKSGLRRFKQFYCKKHGQDKSISHFIDKVSEDMKKPPRQQKRVAEVEINDFIKFLQHLETPYSLETSANTIRVYISAVQNLLKYYRLPLSLSFVNLPRALVQVNNRKHEFTLDNIKEFFVENDIHCLIGSYLYQWFLFGS